MRCCVVRAAFAVAHAWAFCPRRWKPTDVAMASGRRLGTSLGSQGRPRRPPTASAAMASGWPTPAAAATSQERQVSGSKASRPKEDKDTVMDVAAEYVLPEELSHYLELSPRVARRTSNLLAGMKASTVEVICKKPRVRAIRLGNGAMFDSTVLAGDTIYERDFYPQLVRDMRTARRRLLLLGNSGVGTSMFQFYMLARYMNPEQFQDIGVAPHEDPILFGSAAIPKVVIRHLPPWSGFYVLFLEKCVAHQVSSSSVLECFDPATTLYLFEPGASKNVEPIVEELRTVPTLATMYPNYERYRHFRNYADIMYLPVYTKAELLAIGRDMRQPARGLPSDLVKLYSDAKIRKRFDAFNGIFRYVLPAATRDPVTYLTERDWFFDRMNAAFFINANPSTMVESDAGAFSLMYDVGRRADGERDFFTEAFMYSVPRVAAMVRVACTTMEFAELLSKVRSIDELGSSGYDNSILWQFEEVVSRFLTTGKGVRWELRRVGKSPVAAAPVLEEVLKGPIVDTLPAYAEMEVNTLYRSLTPSFSFGDMMFKNGEGALVCIQVSWKPDREVKAGAVRAFCHAVGLCADEKKFTADEARWVKNNVLLMLCPRPDHFSDATLSFEEGCVLEGGDVVRMGEGFRSGLKVDLR